MPRIKPRRENADEPLPNAFRVAIFDTKEYDQLFLDEAANKDPRIDLHYFEPKLNLNNVNLAKGFDAVCVFVHDNVDSDTVCALYEIGVGLIALRCSGFDRVDIVKCNLVKMSVVRVPAYSPHGVAEFAVSLLLALNRKVHLAFNRIRDGNFSISGLVGSNLRGKVIGVIGTGRIGKCFVDIMLSFGCTIKACDLAPDAALAGKENLEYVGLEELFRESEVVALHIPLTAESKHIINEHSLAQMRKGVILLNTSRGALVESRSLIRAIKSGQVGGAGLDVYEEEDGYFFEDRSSVEMQDDTLARLSNMRNVIMTSHQAFLTDNALAAIADCTIDNIVEYIDGKRLAELTNQVGLDTPANLDARCYDHLFETKARSWNDRSQITDDVVGM